MKKIIGFLIVLGVLVLSAPLINATVIAPISGTATRACLPTTTPYITVTSPNGGESYLAGNSMIVNWTSCNIVGNVDISLITPHQSGTGFSAWVFGNSYSNSGHGTFVIPKISQWGNMIYGTNFKILVGNTQTQQDGTNASDFSDNLFTINKPIILDTTIPKSTNSITLVATTATATKAFPAGCTSNSYYSSTTGQTCASGLNLISLWSGKVNQHISTVAGTQGSWVTDPDGVSGANIDTLTYCKKWYPNTVSVTPFQNQTLVNWQDRGNVGKYTSEKMAYQCVQPSKTTFSVPAGCTTPFGYSSTTGQSCGCNGSIYSTYCGQLCPVPTSGSYPIGCTSNYGYSSTTGQSCGCNGTVFSTYNGQHC